MQQPISYSLIDEKNYANTVESIYLILSSTKNLYIDFWLSNLFA